MNYEYKKPTEKIENNDVKADTYEQVTYYKCFCGKGVIEYHNVPGFNDQYFCIECPHCEKKYRYIEWCGYEWRVYK